METLLIKHGRILSPGRFQNEPEWITELWDLILSGMSDVSLHDGSTAYDAFEIDQEIADLTGYRPREGSYVVIWSNDQGFVTHMVMDQAALDAIEAPENDFENTPTREWVNTGALVGFDDHPEYESGY